MQVDISFNNSRVYDINRADVVVGETFTLDLDHDSEVRWFVDNDPAFDIKEVTNKTVKFKPNETGESTVLIMNSEFNILKKLQFRVVDAIVPMAASLKLTAEEPILK